MLGASSALSFGSILSGISKTLTVANQVIPLYQQTKPLFKNARHVYDIFKNAPSKEQKEKKVIPFINNNKEEKTIVSKSGSTGPQFFI